MSNGVKYDDKDSIKNEKRRNNNKKQTKLFCGKVSWYCESMIIQGAMRKTMIGGTLSVYQVLQAFV